MLLNINVPENLSQPSVAVTVKRFIQRTKEPNCSLTTLDVQRWLPQFSCILF